MRAWICLFLIAACDSPPTPPEVCKQVCQRLATCTGAGPYESCVRGFGCDAQTDQKYADCEYQCLQTHSACDDTYLHCRDLCLYPCAPSCDNGCGVGEVCFGGVIPNSTDVMFAATCRKSCTTDDDCGNGEKCIQDVTVYGKVGRVCLPPNLQTCDRSIIGSCTAPTVCNDADTLQKIYFDNHTECGLELVHCANGCEGPTADGGIPDGGSPAACR